jgi:hypothetical protein
MADNTAAKGFVMTPEDEEFNRVKMESRIKQENVRSMLAHPEQEPVAYLSNKRQRLNIELKPQTFAEIPILTDWEMPLYMKPPQRTWVGLTEEEIKYLLSISDNEEDFAYAIENKLKEKNT